jgi:hypothetical protein
MWRPSGDPGAAPGGPRPALLALLLAAACGVPPEDRAPTVPAPPPSVAELERLHPQVRVAGLEDRTFAPELWWEVTLPVLEGAGTFRIEEVGRSAEGRPLRHVAWGEGPVPVLLWSQMHGDESTASMALSDIFRFLGEHPDHPVAARIHSGITLHALPIMNPDGAARFQRRSAHGIDLNRDARALATPEARALKALRDELEPAFGFNLHDQAVGTRVGSSDRGTVIALLAPPFNPEREVNPVRRRAMEVAAVIRVALEPYAEGYMARWDDTFNPRAFGDLMTAWGTSTILIESGGWEGDPQKQHLRKLNFLGILAALEAIAGGTHDGMPVELYSDLPRNGRRVGDLLLRGGTVAVPGLPPLGADLLVNFEHPLAELGGRIADVGDLAETEARDTVFVDGLYLVPREEALEGDAEGRGGAQLRPGAPATFVVSRDPEGLDVVWELRGDVDPQSPRPPEGLSGRGPPR